MNVNFHTPLVGFTGEPITNKEPDGVDEKGASKFKDVPITLGNVCIQALMAQFQDEPNLSGEKKVGRYALASKIHAAQKVEDPVDLQSEDISLLKELVAKGFGVAVVGPAFQLLDPKKEPE
jgi:hypothetical protein